MEGVEELQPPADCSVHMALNAEVSMLRCPSHLGCLLHDVLRLALHAGGGLPNIALPVTFNEGLQGVLVALGSGLVQVLQGRAQPLLTSACCGHCSTQAGFECLLQPWQYMEGWARPSTPSQAVAKAVQNCLRRLLAVDDLETGREALARCALGRLQGRSATLQG